MYTVLFYPISLLLYSQFLVNFVIISLLFLKVNGPALASSSVVDEIRGTNKRNRRNFAITLIMNLIKQVWGYLTYVSTRNNYHDVTMLDNNQVGVTKAPFVNFSVSKILILQKYFLNHWNHHYIWQVELWWHLPHINLIFNSERVFWQCWKFDKITERMILA